MPKKKEEKKPLDLTTDEAMEFLFSKEGAQKIKEEAGRVLNPPPKDEKLKASAKSSRKDTSR
jgi:hypothetical protein